EWHDAGRGERHARQIDAPEIASCVVAAIGAGEHDHAADALLETRSLVAEKENRPRRADAEQPHTGPDEQRAADAITPGRKEDQASAAARGGFIQSPLNRVSVVGPAVAARFDADG